MTYSQQKFEAGEYSAGSLYWRVGKHISAIRTYVPYYELNDEINLSKFPTVRALALNIKIDKIEEDLEIIARVEAMMSRPNTTESKTVLRKLLEGEGT